MPPLVIPDTAQVVCKGGLPGGEVWANVWHIVSAAPGAIDQAEADLIAAPFRQFYADTAAPRITTWSLDEITVRDLSSAGENVWTAAITPVSGAATGIALPFECCIVVTLHTILNTRRGRGRTFQSGHAVASVAENSQQAPVFNAIQRTAMVTAAGALAAATIGTNWNLGVASRADLVTRRVTGGYVDNGWDTQRGRSNDIQTTREFFDAV